MKTVIIIPARYASTRFPGKPLVNLNLRNGLRKSLIQLSWEAANNIAEVNDIYVATDDERIHDVAKSFGAQVIMTAESCRNGTERCADAIIKENIDADLIINLQGDAPLTPHWFVEGLINVMKKDDTVQVSTPVLRMNTVIYKHFIEDRAESRVGGTTVVFDNNCDAMYFSKELIPYMEDRNWAKNETLPIFHHVGVYAYRPTALRPYLSWEEGVLEKEEGLEQLRFLENGELVRCIEVDSRGKVFWELNNPEDVARIEGVI